MKVLIIGSGLGGLSLAQSLCRAGIEFEIFERDKTPFDRPQGYRLHLDEDAINTVKEVLPAELLQLFKDTSQWIEPYTSIMDTKSLKVVKPILTKDDLGTGVWAEKTSGTPVHANVDRATLRQILLTGLGENISFGKKFERYESNDDNIVTAHFSDGSTATGDVLVGADGINSPVHRQRCPANTTMDAGTTAIYGRLSIDSVNKLEPKEALEHIFLIASDQRKVFLGLGPVIFPVDPQEAAKKLQYKCDLQARDNYVVCIVGGRHEYFPNDVDSAAPIELQDTAANLVTEWTGNAASLVRSGDPDSFFVVRMRTSVPRALDKPSNVTLLGDAIHSMTPSLGRGANLAMRHGALLGRHLRKVVEGKGTLSDELVAYEHEMTEYGFKVVREAAEMGRQRMNQNPLNVES